MIPVQMLVAALLAWLDHEQRDVIVFRCEEDRTLKAQLGGRRLQAQAKSVMAVDFFSVDTVWLQRLYVLFVHRGRQPSRAPCRLHDPPGR